MKIMNGLAALALAGLGAASLGAEGLYVLGGLGAKSIYGQDINDYYGSWDNNSAYYDSAMGEADLSLGWRFPGPLAIEGTVGIDTGREASAYIGDGYSSDLTLQPMPTFALGPVFCWDRRSWWFAESGVTELGLRVEYATLSGSETVDGYGSQDFNGSSLGFGLFVRALNIWNPTGFNVGVEAGYDENYFNTLVLTNTSGGFAGNNGQDLENYSGSKAYFDNSGAYIRLVIGWSQAPTNPPPAAPRRRFWRHRVYENYPQSQNYPDDQNYGN